MHESGRAPGCKQAETTTSCCQIPCYVHWVAALIAVVAVVVVVVVVVVLLLLLVVVVVVVVAVVVAVVFCCCCWSLLVAVNIPSHNRSVSEM